MVQHIQSFVVSPTLRVVKQAAMVYLIRKLPRARKGIAVFLSSLNSRIDLLTDIGPSVLGTMLYRLLRLTSFGERHKNSSALITGLLFCYITRRKTLKFLACALAACWLIEVLKTWDAEKRELDKVDNSKKKIDHSSWIFAANIFFTGFAGGFLYFHIPRLLPKWFRDRPKLLLGHDLLKKGHLAKYRDDYMQHCSRYFHARESCTAASIIRFPRCYKRSFLIGIMSQIPDLLLKRNLKRLIYKSHEIALHLTFCLCIGGMLVCLGNATFTKPGAVKRIWRYFHPFTLSAMGTYITTRWILCKPSNNEYFALWFGQATIHSLLETLGDWSFVVTGALALNGLRRRIERSKKSKKSAKLKVGVLLASYCIGEPIKPMEEVAEDA